MLKFLKPLFLFLMGKLSTCDTSSFLSQQFHTDLTEQFSAGNCSCSYAQMVI